MSNQQSIKSIIDGRDLECGELEYDWQEYVIKLQEEIERKNIELIEIDNKLDMLLEQIGNTETSDKIRSIVSEMEHTYACEAYKQGLFKGIKTGLIIKNKNLNVHI